MAGRGKARRGWSRQGSQGMARPGTARQGTARQAIPFPKGAISVVYQWRPGFRPSVPAQAAGERLERLRESAGGHLTPGAVVADARPAEAALHPAFEWDDAVAAERHREEQARSLIRNVYILPQADAGTPAAHVLCNIHVSLPEVGPCYVTTARAVAEPELREQVERDALKAFQALRERYRHIQGLSGVFAAIDRAEAKVAAKAGRRARAVAS
jgi:hypothetical protein